MIFHLKNILEMNNYEINEIVRTEAELSIMFKSYRGVE